MTKAAPEQCRFVNCTTTKRRVVPDRYTISRSTEFAIVTHSATEPPSQDLDATRSSHNVLLSDRSAVSGTTGTPSTTTSIETHRPWRDRHLRRRLLLLQCQEQEEAPHHRRRCQVEAVYPRSPLYRSRKTEYVSQASRPSEDKMRSMHGQSNRKKTRLTTVDREHYYLISAKEES